MKNYDLVVCGGTFDLLHKGHKKFLQETLNLSEKVLLGITSNSYVFQFKNNQIEDFGIRKKNVIDFFDSINSSERVKIVSINQAYEPLLMSEISPRVIVVTPQTEKTAIEINNKRKQLELPLLKIVVIPMEKAEDGELISSTRIRNGEISRDGKMYIRKDWNHKTLILPVNLRSILQKPFGKLLESVPTNLASEKTITIGDISTQKFNEKNVQQFLSIVDFAVHREKRFDKLSDLGFDSEAEVINVDNAAGTITPLLLNAIKNTFSSNKRKIILVKGEEDLAVLPVMLAAPLGFVIYYGQPAYAKASAGRSEQGLVKFSVTEENKERAYKLVNKFTS